MKIDVLSSYTVHAIAGQFIKIEGIITKPNQSNSSNETNRGGIAYISIVDVKDRVPVDLRTGVPKKDFTFPQSNLVNPFP